MRDAPSPDTRPRASRSSGTDGFTLIEALVALVVLALFAAVLQRSVVGTVDGAARAQAGVEASRVASTLIASPLPVQATAGRLEGYDWTVRYEPVAIPIGTPVENAATSFQPMRMIVEVAGGRAAPVRVETVRLLPLPEVAP